MREEWKAMFPSTSVVATEGGMTDSLSSCSRASDAASTVDSPELTQATSTSASAPCLASSALTLSTGMPTTSRRPQPAIFCCSVERW